MKCVVLVIDNNVFREGLALALKQHAGLEESVQAQTLAEARRLLGNPDRHLDLVIVHLELASAVGFELIKELRMTTPGVPLLVIVPERDAYRRDEVLRAGAEEVLTMAAALQEIVDVAKRLVGE